MKTNFFLLIYALENLEHRVLFKTVNPSTASSFGEVHKGFVAPKEARGGHLKSVTPLTKDQYDDISSEDGIIIWT